MSCMIEKIEFGKVINTRGLDGTIKVQTSSEKMSFKNLKNVLTVIFVFKM